MTGPAPIPRSQPLPGFGPDTVNAQVADVVELLRRIPLPARRFTAPRRVAWNGFRLDDAVLDAAVGAGLPFAGSGDDQLFDWLDLNNLALCLPLVTPQRTGARFWGDALRRAGGAPRRFEISFRPTCPHPGHPGPCEFVLHAPHDTEVVLRGDAAVHSETVEVRGDWPVFTGEHRALIDEFAGMRLLRLPYAIAGDVNFAAANGIADCLGYARLLTEVARRRGLVARQRTGLVVSLPYSVLHAWAEFRVDGEWVPCDVGLIGALESWRVLPPGGWDRYRSSGCLLVGHSSTRPQLVTHRGFFTNVSLPTRPV